MNVIEADSDAVVQPGLGWEDLNAALKDKGIPLFFPVRLISFYGSASTSDQGRSTTD